MTTALGIYGVPVEAVAYQEVGTRPADVLAVATATLGENMFALGEAIAGFFRRGTSSIGETSSDQAEDITSARIDRATRDTDEVRRVKVRREPGDRDPSAPR
jgi:hypothetical protein